MSDERPAVSLPSASRTEALPRLGRQIVWASLLAVLCLAGLSAYSDVSAVIGAMRHFDLWWFIVALGLSAVNFLVRAIRWQLYLRRVDVHVPWGESLLVFLSGMAMSVTPGKAGELFKSLQLKWTRQAPIADTGAVVLAERITDLIGLTLLGAYGALLLPAGGLLFAISLLGCVVLFLLTTWERLGRLAVGVVHHIPRLNRKVDRIEIAYSSLRRLMHPGDALLGVLLSVVAWGAQVLTVLAVVHGFVGASMSFQGAAVVYCAPLVAGVASLIPGGIGVTELGMTSLVPLVSPGAFTAATAITLTIIVRLATLWFAVLVGAVSLFWHRRLTGWRHMIS